MEGLKTKILGLKKQTADLKKILKISQKKKEIEKLEAKISKSDFWQNNSSSAKVLKELKQLKNDVGDWDYLNNKLTELAEFINMEDSSLEKEIGREVSKIEKRYKSLELKTLFSSKFDQANAIVEINSGAGGTEACDWALMLFRMYIRWAEEKGFKTKVVNQVQGDEAGIKNITFFIEGIRVYGFLKSERGVHRLVRISPFDSSRRRHTSFASVDIIPEVEEDIDIEIKPQEVRIDTYRSSGAGGQHVNVTDSAVRVTHIPSGIVVSCQNERSQHQNKQAAFKVLKAKLYELKEEEKQDELEKMKGKKQKIEWGSQVRSYILHPYLLVKDHRTGVENHNAEAVLDGQIDDFIWGYLKAKGQKQNIKD
ncbi:MAG: peptide chain release factor 2 [Candidatus Omnitrophica bacterium]|nr:peptide chain release factor 2 [Candidatus Omnitrophota bacterium]MCF7876743.1 peptide chain release factor 2 [Candidatus Omnitrophota bacterium]MCF7878593.1 peptide chain release factor 2 [Candidatus Omnitrophota bacterium]MCF7892849.1 peptide chain release factor 2 [Candidatus Omnitrophota bacterium]